MFQVFTPVLLPIGYVDWVNTWRVDEGEAVYLYGEEFGAAYCPIEIRKVTL